MRKIVMRIIQLLKHEEIIGIYPNFVAVLP